MKRNGKRQTNVQNIITWQKQTIFDLNSFI